MAEQMIRSGRLYSAEKLHALGLVHVLAEPNTEETVRDFIRRDLRHHAGDIGARRAAGVVKKLTLDELERVIEIWADAALGLDPGQLKMMGRLAGARTRLAFDS